jgi:hypothetical protein
LDNHQETDLINDDGAYSTPPASSSSNMKQLLKCSSPLKSSSSRLSPHIIATAAQSTANTPALMLRSQNFSNGNFNAKISAKVPANPRLVLPTNSLSDINSFDQARFHASGSKHQSPHHTTTNNHHNLTLNKLSYEMSKNSAKEYYDNASAAAAASSSNNNNKNIDLINSMNNSDFSKMINDQAFRLSDLFNELNPNLIVNNNNGTVNKSTFNNAAKPATTNTSSFLANNTAMSSSASSASSSPTSSCQSSGIGNSGGGKSLLMQSNHQGGGHHHTGGGGSGKGTHTFNKFPVPFNGNTLTHTTNRIYNKHNTSHHQQQSSANIYSKINDYQANFNPTSSGQGQTKHLNI